MSELANAIREGIDFLTQFAKRHDFDVIVSVKENTLYIQVDVCDPFFGMAGSEEKEKEFFTNIDAKMKDIGWLRDTLDLCYFIAIPKTLAEPRYHSIPNERRELINACQQNIDRLNRKINEIAEQHVVGFHFLDHKVSTFWNCDLSPIGKCVFAIDESGRLNNCIYCNEPVERK